MSDSGTPDLQIKISTYVQLQALRELERSLEKQIAQARALGQTGTAAYTALEQKLTAVRGKLGTFGIGSKLTSELLDLGQKVPFVGTAMNALNGTLGKVSVAAAAAAVAFKLATAAVQEFAAKEAEVARLNQALANSGQYSRQLSQDLQAVADEYEDLTGIDDQRLLRAMRVLVQFGADRSNLKQYTEAVLNLAGIMDGDVEQAAQVFAKAIAGNTEMLSRYGVKVAENLTATQKLDSIMTQLAQRGAGQLAIANETLAGSWTRVKNATGDALVAQGNAIAKTRILQGLMITWAWSIEQVAKIFPQVIEPTSAMGNKFQSAADQAEQMQAKINEAGGAAKDFGKNGADAMKSKLDELATAADATLGKIEELAAWRDKLASAGLALKLAEIEAGPGTPEEKNELKYQARQADAKEQFDNHQADVRQKIGVNNHAADEAKAAEAAASRGVAAQQAKVRALEQQALRLQGREIANDSARPELERAVEQASHDTSTADGRAAFAEAKAALAAQQAKAAALKAERDKLAATIVQANGELEQAKGAAATARNVQAETKRKNSPLETELQNAPGVFDLETKTKAVTRESERKQDEQAALKREAQVAAATVEYNAQVAANSPSLKDDPAIAAQLAELTKHAAAAKSSGDREIMVEVIRDIIGLVKEIKTDSVGRREFQALGRELSNIARRQSVRDAGAN